LRETGSVVDPGAQKIPCEAHPDRFVRAAAADCAGDVGAAIAPAGGAPVADCAPLARATEPDSQDELIARLLIDLKLPAPAVAGEFDSALNDLKTVLVADYREAPGFPPTRVAHELVRVVENWIKPYGHIWQCWQDRQDLHQLRRVFKWGDVVVNAQPYMNDTGLSLWGFSCEAKIQDRNRFVIFLNTAHDPGAIAATIRHELGHYVYGAIGVGKSAQQTAMENVFAQHLAQEEELFADAVVALSAYNYADVGQSLGDAGAGASPSKLRDRIYAAFAAIDPQYRIDLRRGDLAPSWRIRYLTLMIHFLKLRWALADVAGI